MSFFVVNKSTEDFFQLETRNLPAPDGGTLSFTGYKLMWRAFDLLVLGGNWPRAEIVALALRKKSDPTFDATHLLPENPIVIEIPNKRQIDILEGPPVDVIQLLSLPVDAESTELDACLLNVVSSLYQGLRIRP